MERGVEPSNFFGIDINPFAVELAKVTLNIAKKIAFEERKAQALALSGQVELDIDPSLPLDNLDQNIVCADALFTDWPPVDAIFRAGGRTSTSVQRSRCCKECARYTCRASSPSTTSSIRWCRFSLPQCTRTSRSNWWKLKTVVSKEVTK